MSDINPCFSVTVVVFSVYLLGALLGSRERNGAAVVARLGESHVSPSVVLLTPP
jgi:hypothetical protein